MCLSCTVNSTSNIVMTLEILSFNVIQNGADR